MSGRTFREVAADFLVHHRLYTVDPRFLECLVGLLNREFGDLTLPEITTEKIERWFAARLDAGRSKSTLNRYRSGLSVVFEFAIRRGEFEGRNPARAIPQFREGAGRTRYLSPDEAARLILAAAPHLKTVLLIALHTGGRLSEVLALRWGDVDLEAGTLTYRRETTKSRKTRHVPLSPELAAHLAGLPRACDTVCHYEGRRLRRVRGAFERAREQAGLPREVVFHSTRHAAASWFVQRGGSIYDLQKILGHSVISLTERYAHLSPEHIKNCARFLGPPRAKRREEDEG